MAEMFTPRDSLRVALSERASSKPYLQSGNWCIFLHVLLAGMSWINTLRKYLYIIRNTIYMTQFPFQSASTPISVAVSNPKSQLNTGNDNWSQISRPN